MTVGARVCTCTLQPLEFITSTEAMTRRSPSCSSPAGHSGSHVSPPHTPRRGRAPVLLTLTLVHLEVTCTFMNSQLRMATRWLFSMPSDSFTGSLRDCEASTGG